MATTPRGGGAGGGGRERERRSSSSSSNPPHPSSSQKPLPNYLKPTISSTLNSSSRALRRSNTDTSASSTTTTNRRRSYEKPPSPTQLQKALHSSTNTTRTPSSFNKPGPQRSFSSLSSRSAMAHAGPAEMRSFLAKASPTNSSTSGINKIVARKARPRSVTSESSVEFEGHGNYQEERLGDPVTVEPREDARVVAEEAEHELHPEKEEALFGENGEQVHDTKKKDALVVAEEGEQAQEAAPWEKNKDKHRLVEIEVERSIDKSIEEMGTGDHVNQGKVEEENDTKEDLTMVDEKHVVVELPGIVEESKEGEEETSSEIVQVNTESRPTTVQVSTESPSTVVQVNTESPPTVVKAEGPAKKTQPAGKKETQAYNDVIEETASKLMENKRNKVRALAGAFETVISLQDPK